MLVWRGVSSHDPPWLMIQIKELENEIIFSKAGVSCLIASMKNEDGLEIPSCGSKMMLRFDPNYDVPAVTLMLMALIIMRFKNTSKTPVASACCHSGKKRYNLHGSSGGAFAAGVSLDANFGGGDCGGGGFGGGGCGDGGGFGGD